MRVCLEVEGGVEVLHQSRGSFCIGGFRGVAFLRSIIYLAILRLHCPFPTD